MTEATYDSPEQRYSYKSSLIDQLRGSDFRLDHGRVELHVARKFGFCWGVDRAVALVWDAIRDNPGRRIWLLNQIIHNPTVNEDFHRHGVRFTFGPLAEPGGMDGIAPEDLVIIPAFSAEVEHWQRLEQIGCDVVDTTCPWVEKPHRRVRRYLEEGYTVLVHGLVRHDETRATCSLVRDQGGQFLVVRDLDETDLLCAVLRGERPFEELAGRLGAAVSQGFDPERHLDRIGIVNQTTMLASESREVADRVGRAMKDREQRQAAAFRDFDTICPATQDNQDAVLALSERDLDVFLVLGGYDSSNTRNLLRAAKATAGAYHIQRPKGIQADQLVHRDPTTGEEAVARDWLPEGPVRIGISAGASTPDTELAEVVRRLLVAAGCPLAEDSSPDPATREAR